MDWESVLEESETHHTNDLSLKKTYIQITAQKNATNFTYLLRDSNSNSEAFKLTQQNLNFHLNHYIRTVRSEPTLTVKCPPEPTGDPSRFLTKLDGYAELGPG
ncbi:hypothetical protein pipiens_017084 [Culex pipiens pipiens]|uniref:Uncharacterized protein n=1 Tax=Culex pipiens pipiens TaxID=38569 RepID=A0ABD1CI78_CULPP